MKPVVVIATHHREEITCRNIDLLLKQSVVPQIVLVCSEMTEEDLFNGYYDGVPEVNVIYAPNKPLGKKWQSGVDKAKQLGYAPVIIIGSDDLFGKDFIQNICNLNTHFDFVGLNQWFIHDEPNGRLFKMEYAKKDFPLGGGKIFSKRLLEKMNYKLFDVTRDRLLDDDSWKQVQVSGLRHIIINDCEGFGLNIVSVKGNWQTMNTAEAILKSKSCVVLEEYTNVEQKLKELL